jgi:hypothetical protein
MCICDPDPDPAANPAPMDTSQPLLVADWARRGLIGIVVAVLALPLFAHGCHTGDHDDEPAFHPPTHPHEPPWGF